MASSSSSWLSHLRVAALASRNAVLVALLMGMAHLLLKRYIVDTAALARQQGGRAPAMASSNKPAPISGFVRERLSFANAPSGRTAADGADEDEKALYAFIYGKTATSTAPPGPSKPAETASSAQSTSTVSPSPPRPGPSTTAAKTADKPVISDSRDPLDQFFMSPMGNASMAAASVADLQGFSSLDLSGFAPLS